MSDRVLSGKYGEIQIGSSTLFQFTDGELEYGANPEEYFARSGAGAGETIAGAESGSGSFNLLYDKDDPITGLISSGQLVTLIFRHTATGSIEATGQARLGKLRFSMNRSGVPQTVSVPFTTHGAWTFPN